MSLAGPVADQPRWWPRPAKGGRSGAARLIPRARASRTSESAGDPLLFNVQRVMTRAVGDQPGHPGHESREGDDPPRPALPASASAGRHARGRQGEEDATLRGSPADVRSGGPSEARPLRAVAPGRSGSANPGCPLLLRCNGPWGWGEPEPGRRSLQQRGEPARSGMPRPDGLNMTHTISGRA